jgi:MFS family permease
MTTMHFLSDRFGRKSALFTLWFILALVSDFGMLIQATSPDKEIWQSVMTECLSTHSWHWLLAKLLAGMGVGALQVSGTDSFL